MQELAEGGNAIIPFRSGNAPASLKRAGMQNDVVAAFGPALPERKRPGLIEA